MRSRESFGASNRDHTGVEEARLIYLGVSHSIADDHRRRIVVDIGGGSTECILGSDYKPITRHSLYMGCVSYTKRFFADGLLNRGNYERAKIAAEQNFNPSSRASATSAGVMQLGRREPSVESKKS